MATLESILGKSIHEFSEEQLTDFVENLRSVRQSFTDSAYETRTNKRKAAAKRKGPEVTAEFLADIESLADDLDL
jgi:hypothetical protein